MLGAQILLRHDEALLRPSQLEIIARNLCGNSHLRVLIVGPLGVKIRACGLDRTTYMTEQIDLPRGIKSQTVTLRVESRISESRLLLIEMRIGPLQLHMR